MLSAAGFDVERQEYACPTWECDATLLELAGRRLDAAANAYSPACDVTAPTVAAGTLRELELCEMEGRIGILYGSLTRNPLAAKSWFLTSEEKAYLVRLLEEKRPAALITVQTKAGDLDRLIEDWEFTIPSATVPARSALPLLQHAGEPVRLRIESRTGQGRTANVVGRRAGSRPERVTLMAHFDTKIDTPGASDNASGVAVLLELARRLGRRRLPLGLELVAFTGEEYLPIGDDEYMRRGEAELGQIVAAINFDGVADWLDADTIMLAGGAPALRSAAEDVVQRYPAVEWTDPWPESNHSSFSFRGVPAFAFTTLGARRLAHLRTDTAEWISPAKLSQLVDLAADLVEMLQDKSAAWTRPAADE